MKGAGPDQSAASLLTWGCVGVCVCVGGGVCQVDYRELPGPTLIPVPGYEKPVEFGRMFTFAYPVQGCGAFRDGGESQLC